MNGNRGINKNKHLSHILEAKQLIFSCVTCKKCEQTFCSRISRLVHLYEAHESTNCQLHHTRLPETCNDEHFGNSILQPHLSRRGGNYGASDHNIRLMSAEYQTEIYVCVCVRHLSCPPLKPPPLKK